MTGPAADVGQAQERHATGRGAMIGAFADLTTLALRAGVTWDSISRLHGEFFDGNVEMKRAFEVVVLLAENGRHR